MFYAMVYNYSTMFIGRGRVKSLEVKNYSRKKHYCELLDDGAI